MNNLKAEMARYGVRIENLIQILGCSESTVKNKINGKTEFSFNECLMIRDQLFPAYRLEYLFATDPLA